MNQWELFYIIMDLIMVFFTPYFSAVRDVEWE